MTRSNSTKVVRLSRRGAADEEAEPPSTHSSRVVPVQARQRNSRATPIPRLPAKIPDEIIDYYGWIFCRGGFADLQMTFEQFLAVVAAIGPVELWSHREEAYAAPAVNT